MNSFIDRSDHSGARGARFRFQAIPKITRTGSRRIRGLSLHHTARSTAITLQHGDTERRDARQGRPT
jgi:hypothetical protein